jgi:3-phosphoglycerate kinase
MKKTIRDYDLVGKKVIIRVDFNVPMKNGVITDDNRIVESLKTINYAIEKGAKVILMSHLGNIKEESDKEKNTLRPVAVRLSELLGKEVSFVDETRGAKLETAVSNLQPGELLLMENTRFEDLEGKKESTNSEELGAYWASLGELFISDAFGTLHRGHASNVGVASHLPNGVGFLVEEELKQFEKVLSNPERPYTVILGGSKVSSKIKVIENLVQVADNILIGGAMMFTFLKAKGYNVGKSLVEDEYLDYCKEMLEKYPEKIVLPLDCVCGKELSEDTNIRACSIDDIHEDEMGLDLSLLSLQLFEPYLSNSKTIVWNGPVGAFEYRPFADGTIKTCTMLADLTKNGITTIIGGGDTAAAAIKYVGKEAFTHVSTGGGASLELLEGTALPGITAMMDELTNEKTAK